LHNRYWLDNMLKRQYLRSSTSPPPFSLIIINIDNFEEFNNQHGRLYGDRVIYSVAHTISDLLRPTDIITRYRGDEFIVVLPDIDIAAARHIADACTGELWKKFLLRLMGKAFRIRQYIWVLQRSKPIKHRKCLLMRRIGRCSGQRTVAGIVFLSNSPISY
jgi:diguanylate cyclase (GGDEF)-like protein